MPAYLPSELPVRARARQHWIVLLRRPRKWSVIGVALLCVAAWIRPLPMAWVLGAIVVLVVVFRVREWRAERIILTGKRIIHIQGTVETTSSEASLRVDRISGIRLIETVPGKMFDYATIELEAPGDHPGISRLLRLHSPSRFYLELRHLVYGEPGRPDPDDEPTDYVTEELPHLDLDDPRSRRFGRS